MKRELTITDRNGRAALWINDMNIWDLEHSEVTEAVLSAIKSAYERGYEEAKKTMSRTTYGMYAGNIEIVDQREKR